MSDAFDPIALFLRSATDKPDREALRIAGRSFTYAELDRWSDGIVKALVDAGADKERVSFMAAREPASYAAILGILKAGCSYVPLHPDGPPARWQRMIDQCGARLFLGSPPPIAGPVHVADPGPEAATVRSVQRSIGDEAYALFTSGSTGGPKGVSVSRTNVAAYLEHVLTAYDFTERDRFTQFFALTFDLSVHDLFVCWAAGACLCVPADDGALRAGAFAREEGITVWFSVPSLIMLMDRARGLKAGTLPNVRLAFFCGEGLPYEAARAFARAAPNAQLINLYGPTEATIAITSHAIDRGTLDKPGLIPIGRPFPAHKAVIDEEELCVCGPQISAGYIGMPEVNAAAFADLMGTGERWYRTGDRARMDPDGTLHYLGRVDHQVKVAGHRVEPAEVDALLDPLLAGGRAITVPVQEGGSIRLVTFIDVPSDIPALLAHCRANLPAYMVPERIILLPERPLTAHGKTDRQQLIALAAHG